MRTGRNEFEEQKVKALTEIAKDGNLTADMIVDTGRRMQTNRDLVQVYSELTMLIQMFEDMSKSIDAIKEKIGIE